MSKRPVPAPSSTKPERVTVKLSRALVPIQGDPLRELVLRRPTSLELRPLPMRVLKGDGDRKSGATWGDLLGIVAGCTGLSLEDLDKLSARDSRSAVEGLNQFLALDLVEERRKRVKTAQSGAVSIQLEYPLQLGTEKLERLELQPCEARHLRDMPIEPTLGDLLDLGGRLSLQAGAIVDRFDVADALLLIEVAAGFFEDSRPTGAPPS
jgi:hypothetical protein